MTGVLIGKLEDLSLKLQVKLYRCSVRPVPLYWSKDWEMTVSVKIRFQRAKHWMIRMMCDVKVADRLLIAELYQGVGVDLAFQVDVIVRNHLLGIAI